MRCYFNFGTRSYCHLEVQGPGLLKKFDLSGVRLGYPNFMPFDGRAMSYYTIDAQPVTAPVILLSK
jgi:hypothetical protein